VIPLFMAAALEGRPATINGDGEQTRDFTYITNVVQANLLAGTRPAEIVSGYPVNVGAGSRTSLNQLASLVRDVTGRALVCKNVPPRPGDVRDSLAGLERTKRLLGYEVEIDIREGLRSTWEWFRANAASAEAPRHGIATQVA
jgi:UDP-N-acetylglucosamine 4-epimerase